MKKSRELDLEKLKKVYNLTDEKPIPSKFTSEKLLAALYYAYDFMDRALINFCLVGTTADRVLKHMELDGDGIYIAVRRLEWEAGGRRIADAFALPLKDDGTIVHYDFEGVPITLYVLEDSQTIQQPDVQMYHAEGFRIPSPYDQFLKDYPFIK